MLLTVIRHSPGLDTVGRECVVRVSGGPELYLETDLLGVVHLVSLVYLEGAKQSFDVEDRTFPYGPHVWSK